MLYRIFRTPIIHKESQLIVFGVQINEKFLYEKKDSRIGCLPE